MTLILLHDKVLEDRYTFDIYEARSIIHDHKDINHTSDHIYNNNNCNFCCGENNLDWLEMVLGVDGKLIWGDKTLKSGNKKHIIKWEVREKNEMSKMQR